MIQSDAKGCRESSSHREEWLSSAGVRHIPDRYCRRFYGTVTKTLQSLSSYLTHLKWLQVETDSANEGKEGGGRQACWVRVCSETSNGHSDSAQGETYPRQKRSGIWVWPQSKEINIWPPWVPVHLGACREVTQIHKLVQHESKQNK